MNQEDRKAADAEEIISTEVLTENFPLGPFDLSRSSMAIRASATISVELGAYVDPN